MSDQHSSEAPPTPDNYLTDSEWVRRNLDSLVAQYNMRWIAVYQQQIVGAGETEAAAEQAARAAVGSAATPWIELIRPALKGVWRMT